MSETKKFKCGYQINFDNLKRSDRRAVACLVLLAHKKSAFDVPVLLEKNASGNFTEIMNYKSFYNSFYAFCEKTQKNWVWEFNSYTVDDGKDAGDVVTIHVRAAENTELAIYEAAPKKAEKTPSSKKRAAASAQNKEEASVEAAKIADEKNRIADAQEKSAETLEKQGDKKAAELRRQDALDARYDAAKADFIASVRKIVACNDTQVTQLQGALDELFKKYKFFEK